ncbi:Uncharacterised protein [Collinsella aerofaciens]|nr:Uncharacterised protein [Collinsella aerofaciens]
MVIPLVEIASILCSISQSNPRGAAHERSGNSFRGGVSPRFTRRPKGQSTIEYVLIIAIIALLILIVGPWVSSAIRNQFDTVAGAIGSGTAGEGFREPQDIPDAQNGTAFAVYSADDHSLMFYKRRGVPKVGDMFNCRRVTEVYTGFETETYTGTWPDDDCPWFPIATHVKGVTVADDGIKPLSMAWWFNQFFNCESFDLGNLDTSNCVSLLRLFSNCASCTSITGLERWRTGHVIDLSATFDGLRRLKAIPGISGWDTANVKYFAATFYNLDSLELLDLSNWSDSSLEHGTFLNGIGNSENIIGSSYGDMHFIQSFTVGAKWGSVDNLVRLIKAASTSTVPPDGKWYAASDGAAYTQKDIPSNKADTYYASKTLLG